jgi:hypothetical protein
MMVDGGPRDDGRGAVRMENDGSEPGRCVKRVWLGGSGGVQAPREVDDGRALESSVEMLQPPPRQAALVFAHSQRGRALIEKGRN